MNQTKSCVIEWPGIECGGHGTCVDGQCICAPPWSSQSDYFSSPDCYEHSTVMIILYYGMLISHIILIMITCIRAVRWYTYEFKVQQRKEQHTTTRDDGQMEQINQVVPYMSDVEEEESKSEIKSDMLSSDIENSCDDIEMPSPIPQQSSNIRTIRVRPQGARPRISHTQSKPKSLVSTFAFHFFSLTICWCLSSIIVASYHLYTSQRIMYDLIITLFYIPTNVLAIMLWMMTGFRWSHISQIAVYDATRLYDASSATSIHHPLESLQRIIVLMVCVLETGASFILIFTPIYIHKDSHLLRRQLTSAIYMLTALSCSFVILFIVVYCYETINWLHADTLARQHSVSQSHARSATRKGHQEIIHATEDEPEKKGWTLDVITEETHQEKIVSPLQKQHVHASSFSQPASSAPIRRQLSQRQTTRLALARDTITRLRSMMCLALHTTPSIIIVCCFVSLMPFCQSRAGYVYPVAMIFTATSTAILVVMLDLKPIPTTFKNEETHIKRKNGTAPGTLSP